MFKYALVRLCVFTAGGTALRVSSVSDALSQEASAVNEFDRGEDSPVYLADVRFLHSALTFFFFFPYSEIVPLAEPRMRAIPDVAAAGDLAALLPRHRPGHPPALAFHLRPRQMGPRGHPLRDRRRLPHPVLSVPAVQAQAGEELNGSWTRFGLAYPQSCGKR